MKLSQAGKECLRLSLIEGFGLKSFHFLLSQFGSIERIAEAGQVELESAGLSTKLAKSVARSNRERASYAVPAALEDWLSQESNCLLSIADADYPSQLKHTHLAPPLLYVSGSVSVLSQHQIAIVGSRKPSVSGRNLAEEFAFTLARSGVSICSGLALGIDACAHLGALAAEGCTVAVMATGMDRCYPQKHSEIRAKIVESGGAVVSEMPLGTPPLRGNFPRRNRIVSGLSLGVLVVEAGLKSGSLITARYAIEQNREVFSVPGGARNPTSQGCNWLIQEGAHLVTHPKEVIQILPGYITVSAPGESPSASRNAEALKPAERHVLELLGDAVMSMDELFVSSGISLDELSAILLGLELNGLLESIAGGYQRSS